MSAGHFRCDRFELLVRDHDHLAVVGFVAAHQIVVVELLAFLRTVILPAQRVSRPYPPASSQSGAGAPRTADPTGMLTSPNVIVPDHNERTAAPELSAGSASPAALLAPRQLSSPWPRRCSLSGCRRDSLAGAFFFGRTGSIFSPRALASISLHRRCRYSFCHASRIEIGFDGGDELLRELQLVGLRRNRLRRARCPRSSAPGPHDAAWSSSDSH